MSCNAKNPLLSEGRRFANGAKSADGQLDGFPDQWGTCPMFLGRDVCGGSFPAGRVSRPSHKARLFPQVKNLFKTGVPVGQHIYSAGGYISAAPYELSGAASANLPKPHPQTIVDTTMPPSKLSVQNLDSPMKHYRNKIVE